jgi:hypothetical protein
MEGGRIAGCDCGVEGDVCKVIDTVNNGTCTLDLVVLVLLLLLEEQLDLIQALDNDHASRIKS